MTIASRIKDAPRSLLMILAILTVTLTVLWPQSAEALVETSGPSFPCDTLCPGGLPTVPEEVTLDIYVPSPPETIPDNCDIRFPETCLPTITASVETQSDSSAPVPSCSQCRAGNTLGSYDHWLNEDVWVKRSRNYAGEVINAQRITARLTKAESNCYSGSLMWSDADGWSYNQSWSRHLASPMYMGYNDTWTLDSQHNWQDDGASWSITGEADICKHF